VVEWHSDDDSAGGELAEREDVDARGVLTRLGAALNPLLGKDVADYAAARDRFAATRPLPTTVAVIGLTPGEGRTTVAALLALAVAGWSDRRVVVLDTVSSPVGWQPPPAGLPRFGDMAGRTVTALLGGEVSAGRLPDLLDSRPSADVVARSRLRAASTPGAAVPVLSLPPGRGFAPQFVEQSLVKLRQRADLVIIDTPAGPRSPVLHGVLQHADHFLLVVSGHGDVDRRLRAVLRWLDTSPGRSRRGTATGVIVQRGWSLPGWQFSDLPVALVPRDEGLRRRRIDRLGRSAVIAGLTLAAEVGEATGGVTDLAPGPPQSGAVAGFQPSGVPDPTIFGHR